MRMWLITENGLIITLASIWRGVATQLLEIKTSQTSHVSHNDTKLTCHKVQLVLSVPMNIRLRLDHSPKMTVLLSCTGHVIILHQSRK